MLRSLRIPCVVAVAVALSTSACATGSAGGPGGPQLTGPQIEAALTDVDETLYQVLVRTRPEWLIARTGAAAPVVFMDGIETGPIETLHALLARQVERVTYLLPADAVARLGESYGGGVIEVTVR